MAELVVDMVVELVAFCFLTRCIKNTEWSS